MLPGSRAPSYKNQSEDKNEAPIREQRYKRITIWFVKKIPFTTKPTTKSFALFSFFTTAKLISEKLRKRNGQLVFRLPVRKNVGCTTQLQTNKTHSPFLLVEQLPKQCYEPVTLHKRVVESHNSTISRSYWHKTRENKGAYQRRGRAVSQKTAIFFSLEGGRVGLQPAVKWRKSGGGEGGSWQAVRVGGWGLWYNGEATNMTPGQKLLFPALRSLKVSFYALSAFTSTFFFFE